MTVLQTLIGLVASKVEEVHDYVQLVFADGTRLSIFNRYVYDGASLAGIEGKRVQAVDESGDGISIVFDDERSILVSMKDDDYNGPEAMMLMREGESPVVWN